MLCWFKSSINQIKSKFIYFKWNLKALKVLNVKLSIIILGEHGATTGFVKTVM